MPQPSAQTSKAETHKISTLTEVGIGLQTARKNFIVIVASVFINLLGLAFPLFLLQIYDRIIPNQSLRTLVVLVLLVIAAVALEVVLKILRAMVVSWSNIRTEYLKQKNMVNVLLNADARTYERKGIGDYLERLRNISVLRENYSGQSIINFIDVPFAAIFIFLVAYLGGWLVLVPLFVLSTLVVSYAILTKRINHESEDQKENHDRRSNFLIELLQGMLTLKTLGLEKLLMRRYDRLQTRATEINYNLKRFNTIGQTITSLLSQLNTVLIVTFGAVFVIRGEMTVGGLAACTLLSARMIQPVNSILSHRQRNVTQTSEKQKIQALEHIEQTVFDPEAKKYIITNGHIEFKNVNFSYDERVILNKVNLNIPAKSTIAITGTSASGKSTLLQLITGVILPTQGEILLDGRNVLNYNPDYLHKAIIYLSQDRHLFTGTILDNLTMFQDNNKQKAYELAQELGLEPLIIKLPYGYQTEVGSMAVELLAPGIKQMITIVRSLVSEDLKIVLFDEANMALDIPSDFNLIAFLQKLQKRCTMVLVSYRPSILKLADKCYYLTNGKLDEQNSP